MNTGWELGRGKRAGEKDLVDTGGGEGRVGIMSRVGNDRGGNLTGGKRPGGKSGGKAPGGGLDPF